MNKEYYTFADLIAALRKPYQESRLLLNEIIKNIKVESEEPYNIELNLLLEEIITPKRLSREQQLLLELKRTNQKAKLRKILSILFQNDSYLQDYATFELKNDNNYYRFRQHSNLKYKNYYQPRAIIPASLQNDFSQKYLELKESTLYSLPKIDKYINPFQKLYINGNILYLKTKKIDKQETQISYISQDDQIHIKSEKRYSNDLLEELLLTKIPSDIILDEYITFLNSIDNYVEEIYIKDKHIKRNDTLSIEQTSPTLCLKRKK